MGSCAFYGVGRPAPCNGLSRRAEPQRVLRPPVRPETRSLGRFHARAAPGERSQGRLAGSLPCLVLDDLSIPQAPYDHCKLVTSLVVAMGKPGCPKHDPMTSSHERQEMKGFMGRLLQRSRNSRSRNRSPGTRKQLAIHPGPLSVRLSCGLSGGGEQRCSWRGMSWG